MVFGGAAWGFVPCGASFVMGLCWVLTEWDSPYRVELKLRKVAFNKKSAQFRTEQHKVHSAATEYTNYYSKAKAALNQMRTQYQRIRPDVENELQHLRERAKHEQLEEFLRTICLSDYKIPKIGKGRLATLSSYGIETAWDLTRERLCSIPGFGQGLQDELFSWRNQREAEFRFDPTSGLPKAKANVIIKQGQRRHRQIEEQMRQTVEALRGYHATAVQKINYSKSTIQHLSAEVAQAQADLRPFSVRE
jgi:DNA-binding helix-hairpin-helix protein with protein kinase domain